MTTNWVIALPPGQTAALRPVVALHGKGGNANTVIDLGVEDGLAQLVKAGRPPWTAGPATLSTRRPDNSWPNCGHRRPAGMTYRFGASSCPQSWSGWPPTS